MPATIERPVYQKPSTRPRVGPASRGGLAPLGGAVPGARGQLLSLVSRPASDRLGARSKTIRDRWWLTCVTILNLPSMVFVFFYVLSVPGDLAGFVNLALAEVLAVLGLFGGALTSAAFLLTMAATLRGEVSIRAERMLWAVMALSLIGWLYVWISFSILIHMPPLIPFLVS